MEIHKLLSNDIDEAPDFGLLQSAANNSSTSASSSKSMGSSHYHSFSSASTSQHHLTMGLMSDEMWIKIFAFLPPQALCRIGLVCSEWQRLACDGAPLPSLHFDLSLYFSQHCCQRIMIRPFCFAQNA
jgi:hypothetical protein